MHICFLTTEYPPLASGGIGTSIQNLARELVCQGHQVTVLGIGTQKEWNDDGVKVRFLGQTGIPKMGWLLNRKKIVGEINRMVVNEGLEIVEAPDWTGLSAGMKLDCPLVIRCHGSDTYFGHLLGYRPRWAVFQAERMALRQADGVIAVSHFTAEKTRQLLNLSKKIEVIPNGVDLNRFQSNPSFEEDSTILYFGTLARKKGVLDLAEIFSLVVEKNHSAKLILVGRDTCDLKTGNKSTWELFKQKASIDALERIEFVGYKPSNEVVNFIDRARVCVFPSYAETFGLAWVEAMACGKPIVASNIGWANEIIEDGVSGILLHPSSHEDYARELLELIDNPEKRYAMGRNARERVEQLFSIQRVAELSLGWYKHVIDSAKDD